MPAAPSARARLRALWPAGPAPYAVVLACAAAAAHLVTASDLVRVVRLTWDATLTLIALIVLSRLLQEAGLFRWAAWRLLRAVPGDPRVAFGAAVVLSAVVSALFTNDATVLILTPVLAELALASRLRPQATWAVLLANGFVADFASAPLVSSNLVNILAVDAMHLTWAGYAQRMLVPTAAALVVAAGVLWLLYRRSLSGAPLGAPEPTPPPVDRPLAAAGAMALGAAGAAFALTATRPFPTALVLGPAALAYLVVAVRRLGLRRTAALARAAPWDVIVFAAAMNLVVVAADRLLHAHHLWRVLQAAVPGLRAELLLVGGLSAATAALINNLPSTLFWLVALHAGRPGGAGTLALAVVAGDDIGPKLTPIGSLATLIWARQVRERGIPVDWLDYLRAAAVATPVVLAAFLVTLAWG
jgi:arsenical pump membrane protein